MSKILEDALVVVAGGTGNVGEGVVAAFLAAGARVVVPSRSASKLDALHQRLGDGAGRLIGITGDTSTFPGMEELTAALVRDHGTIHHVVAGLGEWWSGKPVWQVEEAEFDRYFAGVSRLHFAAARALVPHIRNGGTYSFLAGLSAVLPLPGVSLVGMQGGAQLMFARALQSDLGERLRVNSLMLGFVTSRARPKGRPEWLSARDVGEVAVKVAEGRVRDAVLRLDDRNTMAATLGALTT